MTRSPRNDKKIYNNQQPELLKNCKNSNTDQKICRLCRTAKPCHCSSEARAL